MTSRADALRVTEAIELLIDAGQWQPADNLYTSRCDNGQVWLNLPAARLGQRTATAFVATPARRDACATHLNPGRLGFYLNEVGLFAMNAGDLTTARDYLTLAVRHARDTGDMRNLAIGLLEPGRVLGPSGACRPGPGGRRRSPHLREPRPMTGTMSVTSHAYLGWLAGLAGDTTAAEDHFTTADQIRLTDDPTATTCTRCPGVCGRSGWPGPGGLGPAQDLTRRNADISRAHGWNADLARCDQILGGLALATGDTVTADEVPNRRRRGLPRRGLPHRTRRGPPRPGRLRPGHRGSGHRRTLRGRGDHYRRAPRADTCLVRRPDCPGPAPRRPVRRRRHKP